MPARLFLVFAFDIGTSANGLAIRNFRRFERKIDVIAFVQFCNDHFDVLLTGACEQKFFGLGIAGKAERGVLFQNLMDSHADFVFIGACFGFNGKCNRRLRDLRRPVKHRSVFVAKRVAGHSIFQFCYCADIAGVQFTNFSQRFPLHNLYVLHSFLSSAHEIGNGHIIFQHAAFDFEIVDSSRERISHRFENENR